MCDPVSVGLMLAGSAIQMKAQGDAADDRERATVQAIERQQKRQRDARQVVDEAIPQWQPGARQERIDDAAGAIEARHTSMLEDAAAEGPGALPNTTAGRVSGAYVDAKAAETAKRVADSAALARLLSKVQGVQRAGEQERFAEADTNTRLGFIANAAAGDAAVDDLRIQSSGQPNALMMGLGAGVQAAGSLYSPAPAPGRLNSAARSAYLGGAGSYSGPKGVSVRPLR